MPRMVVVLPAAFGPRKPTARLSEERAFFKRNDIPVVLPKPVDF